MEYLAVSEEEKVKSFKTALGISQKWHELCISKWTVGCQSQLILFLKEQRHVFPRVDFNFKRNYSRYSHCVISAWSVTPRRVMLLPRWGVEDSKKTFWAHKQSQWPNFFFFFNLGYFLKAERLFPLALSILGSTSPFP